MKLFISYSHDDTLSVAEVAETLQSEARHVVWYDRRLVAAEYWWDTILTGIEDCDCLIAILTPRYTVSIFCMAELNYALDLNKPILPLLLKNCEVPERLASRQHLDVRHETKLERIVMRCGFSVSH